MSPPIGNLRDGARSCRRIALLCRDAGSPDEPLARSTGYEYLDVLSRLMVIEDQPAWWVHLRSKATLRQHPKRHFVDPSLAVAALAASPQRLRLRASRRGLRRPDRRTRRLAQSRATAVEKLRAAHCGRARPASVVTRRRCGSVRLVRRRRPRPPAPARRTSAEAGRPAAGSPAERLPASRLRRHRQSQQ